MLDILTEGHNSLAFLSLVLALNSPNLDAVRDASLTSAAHGFASPLNRDQRGINMHLAKSLQYQQGFFQGQVLEGRPHHRGMDDLEAIRRNSPRGDYTARGDEKRLEATGSTRRMRTIALAIGGILYMMSLFRSDSKYYSYMFKDMSSGDASGSGGVVMTRKGGDDWRGR
ncbi:hypothetical protein Tco_1383432 [Tanacetum coccineum]